MFATANESVSRTIIGTIGTALFAGACLLAATAPAAAQDAPRAQTVSYSDLNLSNSHGREALTLRIKQAARNVCETGLDDVRARTEEARCVRAAVDGAASKMAVTTAAADRG
nr:UrcA family protein [Polymorphobacter sp.]